TGAAALAASAMTMKAASAASVTPFGQTGAPTLQTPLPLGPLPGARYPDARLESLKKKGVSFGPTGFPAFAGTMAVERVATGFRCPANGIGSYYEGIKTAPEQDKKNIYRMATRSGDIKVVLDDLVEPNGVRFSPDEKKLYICHSGFTDGRDNPSHIRVFDVYL